MRLSQSGKALLGLTLVPLAALLIILPPVGAQQSSTPSLHHRTDGDSTSEDQPHQDSSDRQPATLPADVSGTYEFDRRNESIEIDISRNKVTGYISRLGDAETDDNTPLTFFFDRASVDGNQIQFQTRVVHGLWYSFRGTILRGNGRTREEEGYYILHGTLQEHHPQSIQSKSANETFESRNVDFKSMGQ